ncbi:MAG: bifunctional UDP-N-acetylglucosamine diphosphorylase/glucosamine-1-phosphate N-acetyltransferase GlmU [Erysipelotrichales bacterium]|nr:bifunctional UDP-N-acetylglucosamine diphosphorylase/glucosamine-1-phosphate N-acetyltransferase GlmU [Erysipelotrichales bacterium]
MNKYAIILSAGKGTRMKTELPKCAYPLYGKPMINYILENLRASGINDIWTIVGHKKEVFEEMLKDTVNYAVQNEQLGTGHAVKMAALAMKDLKGITIILAGDTPLIDSKTISDAIDYHNKQKHTMTIVSTDMDNPFSYGRIVRNKAGNVIAIREEKDCSEQEKLIKEINSGLYVIDNQKLFWALERITNNNVKNEYYLTDIVGLLQEKEKIGTYKIADADILIGINDLVTLSEVEQIIKNRIDLDLMQKGINLINRASIFIGPDVKIEEGVTIYPNTILSGPTIIGKEAIIGPNSEIHNSMIGSQTKITHSVIYNSKVGNGNYIGPYAHIRDNSVLASNNRIGNFVEVKSAAIKDNVMACHLAYLGDAEIGSRANIGCGAVTVNFDGKNKHKTVIGKDAFIGCNVNLIAPLTIGDNAFIACGTTLGENLDNNTFAISRPELKKKPNKFK